MVGGLALFVVTAVDSFIVVVGGECPGEETVHDQLLAALAGGLVGLNALTVGAQVHFCGLAGAGDLATSSAAILVGLLSRRSCSLS